MAIFNTEKIYFLRCFRGKKSVYCCQTQPTFFNVKKYSNGIYLKKRFPPHHQRIFRLSWNKTRKLYNKWSNLVALLPPPSKQLRGPNGSFIRISSRRRPKIVRKVGKKAKTLNYSFRSKDSLVLFHLSRKHVDIQVSTS